MTAIIAAVASGALCVAEPLVVSAAGDETHGGVAIDVSVRFAGRYSNPPDVWDDPCESPYEFFSGETAPAPTEPVGRGRGVVHDDGVNSRIAEDGVTERRWFSGCVHGETWVLDVSRLRLYWIADPSPDDLAWDLFDLVPEYLDPPAVEWPNAHPDYGWLFVKVPMDFRVRNLNPLTIRATVSNVFGTRSASVTAEPERLTFESGEGDGATCSADAARDPYVPAAFGDCSYRYRNSSSIAGGLFATETTMTWDVSSVPANPARAGVLDTFAQQPIAVSEVQALVSCSGSGC